MAKTTQGWSPLRRSQDDRIRQRGVHDHQLKEAVIQIPSSRAIFGCADICPPLHQHRIAGSDSICRVITIRRHLEDDLQSSTGWKPIFPLLERIGPQPVNVRAPCDEL